MTRSLIISAIESEVAKLTQARKLLTGSDWFANERKRKTAPAKAKKPHVLSPEARERIADAQRKRWAAQKSKAK
jgi:hypothetical protein